MGRTDITSRTRPVRIRASARRAEAVKLRLAGLSYREIGRELGIGHQSAHELVGGALDEFKTETLADCGERPAADAGPLRALRGPAAPALPPEAAPGVERLIGLVLQEHLGVRLRSAAPL